MEGHDVIIRETKMLENIDRAWPENKPKPEAGGNWGEVAKVQVGGCRVELTLYFVLVLGRGARNSLEHTTGAVGRRKNDTGTKTEVWDWLRITGRCGIGKLSPSISTKNRYRGALEGSQVPFLKPWWERQATRIDEEKLDRVQEKKYWDVRHGSLISGMKMM